MSDEIRNHVDAASSDVKSLAHIVVHQTHADITDATDRLKADILANLAAEKAAEDIRANKRNHNRLMLMGVAAVMTIAVPTVLPIWGLAYLLRYATFMAIVPDLGLTAYAWFKKY